jgi:ABC-type lipoprotein release transport system permease subunit
LLATGGVIGGVILGGALVAYFTINGIYIGDFGITGVLFEERIYAHLTIENTIILGVATYVITLAASFYPALLAAWMEPVEALHGIEDVGRIERRFGRTSRVFKLFKRLMD